MAINWLSIYKRCKGKWIALKRDEKTVVASGPSAKDVYRKAKEAGFKDPILSYVPMKTLPMVG